MHSNTSEVVSESETDTKGSETGFGGSFGVVRNQCGSHRVDLRFWSGCNFYQIRPRLQVCNFYKIRPEIWDQLLQFKGQISNFPPPPSAAVFLGPNFRFVRLDFGSVQDFGILVGEHDAGIKSSKNASFGSKSEAKSAFFLACRRRR